MFRSGYMYQWDHSQHLVESYYDATVLIPTYHQVIGWNPYYYLGYPQGQFNPPMGYVVYAVLYYALSWLLSSLDVYKVMIALFYVLPAITLYFAARVFGLSRISGFFAGLVAIGTAGGFEQSGPVGMMEYGMYEYAGAIALIPFILALYHLAFKRKSWILVFACGLLTAFDFLLHTLAGTFLIVILTVYTVSFLCKQTIFHRSDIRFKSSLAKFAIVVLLTMGLVSFWVIPAYANQSYYTASKSLVTELGNYGTTYNYLVNGLAFGERTIYYSWSVLPQSSPEIIVSLFNQHQLPSHYPGILFYQVLMVLAGIGAIVGLVKKESRFPAFVSLLCIGLFFFISLGPTYYESLWQFKLFQLVVDRPARAIAPARIMLALLVGVAIGDGFVRFPNILKRFNSRSFKIARVISILIIAILVVSILANSLTLMPKMNMGATTNDYSSASSLNDLFTWLKANVPNTSRIAFQEYPAADQHLFAIAPMLTGDQIVGSDYGFWWSSGAAAALSANTVLQYADYYSSNEIVDTLSGLNAAYLVAWQLETKAGLMDFSQLTLVKTFGVFNVYELKGYTPSYVSLTNGTGQANVTVFQPENIVIHVTNASVGSDLLVKIAYFGSWVATSSNGERLSIHQATIQLPLASAVYMSIPLTKSGSYNVTLSYGQPKGQRTGNDLTVASMVFSLFGFAWALSNQRMDIKLSDHIAKLTKGIAESSNRAMKKRSTIQRIAGVSKIQSAASRRDSEIK